VSQLGIGVGLRTGKVFYYYYSAYLAYSASPRFRLGQL
jgi:hypothetical protein